MRRLRRLRHGDEQLLLRQRPGVRRRLQRDGAEQLRRHDPLLERLRIGSNLRRGWVLLRQQRELVHG